MLKAIAEWFLQVLYPTIGLGITSLLIYLLFGWWAFVSISLFNVALFMIAFWPKKEKVTNADPS